MVTHSSCHALEACDGKTMCMDLEQTRLQENTLQLAAAESQSATVVVMGGMSVDVGVDQVECLSRPNCGSQSIFSFRSLSNHRIAKKAFPSNLIWFRWPRWIPNYATIQDLKRGGFLSRGHVKDTIGRLLSPAQRS